MPQGGAAQVPAVQRRSRSQLSPRQQSAPIPPHATHIPMRHTPPESHTSPQHGAPTGPHATIASIAGAVSMLTSGGLTASIDAS